jgi:DNA-binding Lrp family transcriptional regulator
MRPKSIIPAAVTSPPGAEEAVPLGELDRRIVAALQINGRATWQQVANVVGASESAVSRRANRMIRQGLLRIIAAADPLRCGLGFPVLLQIECAVGAAGAVARTLAARPDVRFVALLGGGYDLVVELIVPSRAHLTAVLVEELNTVPGIVRTTTENVVRNFKTSYDWSRTLLGEAAALLDPPTVDASPPQLDDIDLRLIHLLGVDGRRSVTDVAERLGISESAARRRLEQLTASGCLRFGTLIDSELLGYHWELFVWLGVDLGRLDRIARELATHVTDATWRAQVCAGLARTPEAVNGLLIGVGALSHRDVLDLYPALCALGAQLPVGVHADLLRATVRPLSPAGVAALRLGL